MENGFPNKKIIKVGVVNVKMRNIKNVKGTKYFRQQNKEKCVSWTKKLYKN